MSSGWAAGIDNWGELHLCISRTKPNWETDVKYMYGRTPSASEEVEYVNAAHVFSDILAGSQESLLCISPNHITDHRPEREVSTHRTMLTRDLRCQCFTWTDLSLLGLSPARVYHLHHKIRSSTQIPESNFISHTTVWHFHRSAGIHNGLCTRIPTSHGTNKMNSQIVMQIQHKSSRNSRNRKLKQTHVCTHSTQCPVRLSNYAPRSVIPPSVIW